MPKKGHLKSWDIWLKQFAERHGDAFDYSTADYKGNHTPISVICPIHGSFSVRPSAHVRGSGCRACSSARAGRKNRMSFTEWVDKARKVHGDKYQYVELLWDWPEHTHARIKAICPEHGEFIQVAKDHLAGHQCNDCGYEESGSKTRLSHDEWIEKATNVHGEFYDYSTVRYTITREPVTITCRIHGPFTQIAGEHLSGYGCALCGRLLSGWETPASFLDNIEYASSDCYVYVADIDDHLCKVGISVQPEERARTGDYLGYLFVSGKLCRCEAWTIEQLLLLDTLDAFPELGEEWDAFGGRSELRLKSEYDNNWYRTRFAVHLERLQEIGWLELFQESFGDRLELAPAMLKWPKN